MQVNHFHLYWPWTSFMSFLPQQFFPVLEEIETKYQHRVNATCDFNYKTKALGQTRAKTERWKSLWLLQTVRFDWLQKIGQRSNLVSHGAVPSFCCDLCVKTRWMHGMRIMRKSRLPWSVHRWCFAAPGPAASERLLPAHRAPDPGHSKTWASSAADESWSSPSATHPQRNGTTTSAGGPMTTKTHRWFKPNSVPTISRFSFARPLSFSSIFWIVWVKSSFLLFSSLFLSSRGLHCFSDSRTRFSWWRGEMQSA